MATTAEQEFFKGTLLCLKMLCCLTKVFPEKYTCFNKKPLVRAGKKDPDSARNDPRVAN